MGVKRILVADDDRTTRFMLQNQLSALGYEVDIAEDGADAVSQLRVGFHDLVLTDVIMPNQGAHEVLEFINLTGMECDVLVMSATSCIQTAVELIKLGAVNYLQKPLQIEQVRTEVQKLLRAREDRTEKKKTNTWGDHIRQNPIQLGRYEIFRKIGEGGMGDVYEAKDPTLCRMVAIKTMRQSGAAQKEEALERFRREGLISGALHHPAIAAVYDFGFDEATEMLYMVMEKVQGVTLTNMIRKEGRLPPERTLTILKQIVEALIHAHQNGVVHRDVKPDNVMLLPGDKVKLLDFGIAKVATSDLTITGSFIGSPCYVSPEMATGKKIDYRTDQFSLGTVLFEMLTGVQIFQAENLFAMTMNVVEAPTPPLSKYVDLPPELDRLVQRLHAKDPDNRYVDEQELIADIAIVGAMIGMAG